MNTRRTCRLALGGLALAAGLMAGPLRPNATHAFISVCRDDPILTLSNSHKDQISFSVPDTTTFINSVTSIVYNVHIPAGVTVTSQNDPGSPFTGKETVHVFADNPAGEYSVSATLYSSMSTTSITLTQQVVQQLGKNAGTSSTLNANGFPNQALSVDLKNMP